MRARGVVESTNYEQQVENICRVVNEQCRCGIGPHGTFKLIKKGVGRDADFELSSLSSFYVNDMSFQHDVAKILMQTLKAHLNSFHDHGFTFLFVCTDLVLRLKNLGENTQVILLGIDTAIQWTEQFFDQYSRRVKFDSSSLATYLRVVNSVLSSNALVDLNEEERQQYCIQIVKAFLKVVPSKVTNSLVAFSNVHFHSIVNPFAEAQLECTLVNGVIIDLTFPKEITYLGVENMITDATIVLFDLTLSYLSLQEEATANRIVIGQVEDEQSEEAKSFSFYSRFVHVLQKLGVGVVVCQKTIDPQLKYLLAQQRIIPFERISLRYIHLVRDISQATIISSLKREITPDALGKVKLLKEMIISGRSCTVLEGVDSNSSRVTLQLTCKYGHITKELERLGDKSVKILMQITTCPYLTPGSGVTERDIAEWITNRVEKRSIAGCDEFCGLSARLNNHLKAVLLSIASVFEQLASHINKGPTSDSQIVDSLLSKRNAFISALETASMIMRIDEIVKVN